MKFLKLFAIILVSSIESNYAFEVSKDDFEQFRNELMYPYNLSDLTELTSAKPLHDQPLPFRLPFFGFSYHYIWIQRDGYLAFNKGLLSYKFPLKFPIVPRDPLLEDDPSMIAPWFALQDIPTEVPYAGVYLKIVNLENESNATLKDRIYADFSKGMVGAEDFRPKFALIITWRNMTMVNRRPEKPLVTNTYQCVLATDEIRTYAMFNYEQIQWITHQDNYEGLKGSAAFVGFNAGNSTQAYEFRPYSQNPRIAYLTTRGFGNGLKGRHLFQIDEMVFPGSCIEKDLDPSLPDRLPLTFFPQWGNMLGGTLVNITGPCVTPDDVITCKFENWRTPGTYHSQNRISCISPPVMYHGYIDLTVQVNDRTQFVGQFYLEPPGFGSPDVIILNNEEYDEESDQLTIKWRKNTLSWDYNAGITISLWGYKEIHDLYPHLTYIDTLVDPGSIRLGQQSVVLNKTLNNITDITMGFIAINLTHPVNGDQKNSPVLWSKPIPLSWYFNTQWKEKYGKGEEWKNHYCKQWFDMDSQRSELRSIEPKCPCTAQQAMLDIGRFLPDNQCNVVDRQCADFHRGALQCFVSGRPSTGGEGQTCCYDDYNELIRGQDSIYSGRPSRAHSFGKHPFKTRDTIPVLSEWMTDRMPFLFCCKWQLKGDDSQSCQMYNQLRPSQDCTAYKSPAVASVYGDPHFITFDGLNYTFNGKGEYILVQSHNQIHNFDVHARFEQLPRQRRTDPSINATELTAMVVRDGNSSVVEFRLRPMAASWRYKMFLIVDKEYIFWNDENERMKNFRGVTLYQPMGIQNMSHIIAMFDSGAGVEVTKINGHLTVHVYAPETFKNETAGLLGKYDNDFTDDFTLPNGTTLSTKISQKDIHNQFGQLWRLNRMDSLFYHDSVPFDYYDDPSFVPELSFPLQLPDWAEYLRPEMDSVCGDSVVCQYDYVMTFDKDFAKTTKEFDGMARYLQTEVNRTVIRCPALSRPINGKKSENRYWSGTIVRFSCNEGYRLSGNQMTKCDEKGLWTNDTIPSCEVKN